MGSTHSHAAFLGEVGTSALSTEEKKEVQREGSTVGGLEADSSGWTSNSVIEHCPMSPREGLPGGRGWGGGGR